MPRARERRVLLRVRDLVDTCFLPGDMAASVAAHGRTTRSPHNRTHGASSGRCPEQGGSGMCPSRRRTERAYRTFPPRGTAFAPLTGPHRVPVTMHAFTSAVRTGSFQPFMKSACSVVMLPCSVGLTDSVRPAADEVG